MKTTAHGGAQWVYFSRRGALTTKNRAVTRWDQDYAPTPFGEGQTAGISESGEITCVVDDCAKRLVFSGPGWSHSEPMTPHHERMVVFSKDANLAAVGSFHGSVQIHSVLSYAQEPIPFSTFESGRLDLTTSMCFSGDHLAVGSSNGLALYDVHRGTHRILWANRPYTPSMVETVRSDGAWLLAMSHAPPSQIGQPVTAVFDIRSPEPLARMPIASSAICFAKGDLVLGSDILRFVDFRTQTVRETLPSSVKKESLVFFDGLMWADETHFVFA